MTVASDVGIREKLNRKHLSLCLRETRESKGLGAIGGGEEEPVKIL